ncbi:hypothetical protein BDA99DRAFT_496491 [Phascolomyces articulosus]|uniref:F-box domain-containing protein n=1 Tax=Phascolomyces articulosus TaxID=60185 RepID=A0AAD5K9R6_9FUNG|nr:hypothetical protein BDA99DRAFT_496491 [Phascolomyces articulosus]
METLPTYISFIDQQQFEQYTHQLSKHIQNKAYEQAIHNATLTIDHILKSQLFVLLDIRAQAYFLRHRFDAVCADAQTMIQFFPESATGYIRKARLLSMHGYQRQAIDIYNKGLQNTKVNDSKKSLLSNIHESRTLEQGLKDATKLNNKRIDFFSQLPTECVCTIISLLNMKEKATCMLVNNLWRQYILDWVDPSLWEHFTIQDKEEDMVLVKAAPYFAHRTKTLVIDSKGPNILSMYLKYMVCGHFKNIHSLKMTGNGASRLWRERFLFANAIYKTRHSLRCLDLTMKYDFQVVTLAQVVSACDNVTHITYQVKCFVRSANNTIGDFKVVNPRHSLNNLTLTLGGNLIEGEQIVAMLQRCPKLRRFVISACDPSILDVVREHAPEGLKIFAMNPDYHHTVVPDLPPNVNYDRTPSGLWVLIAYGHRNPIPPLQLLPLIYKHRTTLATIRIDISEISVIELQRFNTTYPDFRFSNLLLMMNFSCYRKTHQLLLEATYDRPILKTLTGTHIYDVKSIIKSVRRLPSLSFLNMMHVRDWEVRPSDVLELFDIFTRRSNADLTSLNHITLREFWAIDDTVLCSLANIKTLESVMLWGLVNVSTSGLCAFIQHAPVDRLKHIKLNNMYSVTDDTLNVLCNHCSSLIALWLHDIPNVTKEGVDYLLENTSSENLKEVDVKNCEKVGADRVFCKKK